MATRQQQQPGPRDTELVPVLTRKVERSSGIVAVMESTQHYDGDAWISVRCVLGTRSDSPLVVGLPPGTRIYDERITLWRAPTFAEAIRLAEADAAEYARDIEWEYIGLAQSYHLPEQPGHGEEVFSLFRASRLSASEYLTRFFDTGRERGTPLD